MNEDKLSRLLLLIIAVGIIATIAYIFAVRNEINHIQKETDVLVDQMVDKMKEYD